MNGYYEKIREEDKSISLRLNDSAVFPAHYHINVEVLLLLRGKVTLVTGGQSYVLGAGDIAVVNSYEVHSYIDEETQDGLKNAVIIFPYKYLQRFSFESRDKTIAYPVIHDKALCEELLALAKRYFVGTDEDIKETAADLFLTLLCKRLTFTEVKMRGESALVREILAYVQENFRHDVSRRAIARALGYAEEYISRVFHKYIKQSISQFANDLRLTYIDRLRSAGDKRTTLELLYEAGFNSQQTYYRARKVADKR